MARIDYSSDWGNIKTSLMAALPIPQTYSAKKSIILGIITKSCQQNSSYVFVQLPVKLLAHHFE